MSWWDEFANRTELDAPIGRMTWFRLGGRGRYLVRPRDADDLAAVVCRAREAGVPVKVLGAGANVLVRDDGFDGVVVRLDQPAFRRIRREGTNVRVGGGVDLMPLVKSLSYEGLAGLECLAGIPGTIGGAVRMNAGGPAGSIGDRVREADVLAPAGHVETWDRDRLGFGYRHSALGEAIVLSAWLELVEDDPRESRARFDAALARKVAAQPLADRSAGCMFKNPPGDYAGRLIDQAGLKGMRRGGAAVSTRHANFIVADKDATAGDVLDLMESIRDTVRDRFGVELEPEVDIW
ncbi:MAG TPA: UDP-N-acetylmuramate dehydrogenase [Phycisphaerae bacterium]|nr:UDP-N-acetylmuramate dehydrogenase [Phycisphaerae bacterium]HNU44711.1 UDP-N-acetylmuramate dehydrogenase [Phycisphaerae bacterium]